MNLRHAEVDYIKLRHGRQSWIEKSAHISVTAKALTAEFVMAGLSRLKDGVASARHSRLKDGVASARHSRLKDGVASARLCPACAAEAASARRRPGHHDCGSNQPDFARSAACFTFSGSAAIFTPARSVCSSITTRESRPSQPRLQASLMSA
jgi:hypothetical protein